MVSDPQGVDCLLPAFYFLDLVKEQIELLLAVTDLLTDVIVKSMVFTERLISQVFKIQKNRVWAVDFIPDLLQQYTLAAASKAGQDFDDILADKGADFR